LLVSDGVQGTLGFVRAMHSAGFDVLERVFSPNTLELALRGDFDLIAWATGPEARFDTTHLSQVSQEGLALVALLGDASSEAVSACLMAGADACLALDADERVVIAQVHAVLRRQSAHRLAPPPELGLLQIGDLAVDTDRCEVARAGQYVPLTASEFRIVEFMARNAGKVLRPHEILNAVTDGYTYSSREAQDVFKVYARRIRRKLEPDEQEPRYMVTVRGFGYRLEGGAAATAARERASQTA
jgi:DNA-binding response OmpR family regulator